MRYLHIVVILVIGITSLAYGSSRLSAHRDPQAASACVCPGCRGSYRVEAKRDTAGPPEQIRRDHQLTPSDVAAWPGPGGVLHENTPRSGRELEWFRVTGRLVARELEADGDLHLQLVDSGASPSKTVQLIVEIPNGAAWCPIRREVVALSLADKPVIEVVGRAFYDAEHAVGADTKANRRPCLHGARCAIWEIHPVMALRRIGGP